MGKQAHQLCREPPRSGSKETGPARDYTPTNNIIFFHAPGSFPHSKINPNTAIPMVAQCCYHGQSPPITTNHPPITSEIHDQSPSNHLKTTSTGTTYHRPVTSTEHETFSLSPSLFLSRTLVQSRLFFPSLAFLNQKRAGTETVDREMLEAHIHSWSHLEWKFGNDFLFLLRVLCSSSQRLLKRITVKTVQSLR